MINLVIFVLFPLTLMVTRALSLCVATVTSVVPSGPEELPCLDLEALRECPPLLRDSDNAEVQFAEHADVVARECDLRSHVPRRLLPPLAVA